MAGFFFPERKQTQTINSFIGKGNTCSSCGRYRGCKTPKMKPYGEFNKKIMLLVESPGATCDRLGVPLQSRHGKKITKVLRQIGVDVFKDCVVVHSISCFSEEKVKPKEILCCKSKVIQSIKQYRPNIIIPFGGESLDALIGHYWKKKISGIHNWRGWQIPDRNYQAWVCPVFAPWFIEQSEEKYSNLAESLWVKDLIDAVNKNERVQFQDDTKYIHFVHTKEEFKEAIKEISKARWISFDYETTGLKPHAPGHEIICVSCAVSPTEVFVWENTEYRAKVWAMILKNDKIKKSAHNLSFENLWSTVLMKTKVHGWDWCSMNTAHILDNRQGVCGLKFQSYVNFGVIDYDSQISPYLESPPKEGANAKNKIKEFIQKYGIKPVLTYCALDSLYGYRLTEKQREKIVNIEADELIPF